MGGEQVTIKKLANEFSKLIFHFHASYDEVEQYPLVRKKTLTFGL